jgi:hypothetical protein
VVVNKKKKKKKDGAKVRLVGQAAVDGESSAVVVIMVI